MKEFYQKWNIAVDYQSEFEKFKNRLLADCTLTLSDYIADNLEVCQRFDYLRGDKGRSLDRVKDDFHQSFRHCDTAFEATCIWHALSTAENVPEVAKNLKIMFQALNGFDKIEELVKLINNSVMNSIGIGFCVVTKQGEIHILRSGEKLLDERVNVALTALIDIPEANESFSRALLHFLENDSSKYRNILDDLRHATEGFLRYVLNNKKSLENQEIPLLQKLTDIGVHSNIRSMIRELFFKHFTNYQNNAVKHGTREYTEEEVEFMIYLVATFFSFVAQHDLSQSI